MSGTWGYDSWGRPAWGGSPDGGSAPPVVADGPTLIAAVRSYLQTFDDLNALTGIYRAEPKRNFTYPFMVINEINGESETTNTTEYMEIEELQFSVVSPDDLEASRLAKRARKKLLPHRVKRLRFYDGYVTGTLPTFHARVMQQPGSPHPGPANQNIWMSAFGIRFGVGRTELDIEDGG